MLMIKNKQEVDRALEHVKRIAPGFQVYQCFISDKMVTRIEIRIAASETERADTLLGQGWEQVCMDKMRCRDRQMAQNRVKGWQLPDVYVLRRRMAYNFE